MQRMQTANVSRSFGGSLASKVKRSKPRRADSRYRANARGGLMWGRWQALEAAKRIADARISAATEAFVGRGNTAR